MAFQEAVVEGKKMLVDNQVYDLNTLRHCRRMKPEYKKLWTNALRSGKYVQTIGHLRSVRGGFCCLGVACDVNKDALMVSWAGKQFLGEETKLPAEVGNLIGIGNQHGNPVIPIKVRDHDKELQKIGVMEYQTLAGLNDFGLTFPQIADIIDYFY